MEEDEKKKESGQRVKAWLLDKKRQELTEKYRDFLMLNADQI